MLLSRRLIGLVTLFWSQIPLPDVGNCSVLEPHAIAHVVSLVAGLIVVHLDALAVAAVIAVVSGRSARTRSQGRKTGSVIRSNLLRTHTSSSLNTNRALFVSSQAAFSL